MTDGHRAVDNEFRAYLTRLANALQKKEYENEEGIQLNRSQASIVVGPLLTLLLFIYLIRARHYGEESVHRGEWKGATIVFTSRRFSPP